MIRTLTITLLASATLLGAAGVASAKPAVCADISVSAKVRNDAGCFAPDAGPVAPSGTGDSPTVTGTVPNGPAHQLVYDPQEKIDAPRFMDFAVVPRDDSVA